MTRIKLASWNVNGLRAILKKGALQDFLAAENPDILCLQETKANREQVEIDLPDYEEYWNSAERAGYSGTAVFVKNSLNAGVLSSSSADTLGRSAKLTRSSSDNKMPTSTTFPPAIIAKYHLDQPDHFGTITDEGRLQTLEFPQFYLVNTYVPNSKQLLERLDLRANQWDPALCEYLQQLARMKPVIVCGDFNAAHTEIDLARPKQNEKHAGFTPEERQGIKNLLDAGMIDTFRYQHPSEQRYTWWSHWGQARLNNVGWRIDYFFISKNLLPCLKFAEIHENYEGSDHCPVSLTLDLNKLPMAEAAAVEQPSNVVVAPAIEAVADTPAAEDSASHA